MNENITLKIDNREISVPKGTTILEAARELGIDIPTLCYMNLKDLCIKNAPASCRICVVEVDGRKNLAPSCATRCENGMNVHTNTMRVLNARRTVLDLMLSDHPSDCLVCAKSVAASCKPWPSNWESAKFLSKVRKPNTRLIYPLLSVGMPRNVSIAVGAK